MPCRNWPYGLFGSVKELTYYLSGCFLLFFYVAGAGAPEHKAPRPQTVELPENPSYEDTDTDISPEEAQMVGNCVCVCVCVCVCNCGEIYLCSFI